MSYLELLSGNTSLYSHIPVYFAWGTGIAIGVVLVRRAGGAAAQLFLLGCISQFMASLAGPFLGALGSYIVNRSDISNRIAAINIGLIRGIPVGALTIAGFVCLAAAFLLVFLRKREAARP